MSSSAWAQLEMKAPHDFALHRRMREKQKVYRDVVKTAGSEDLFNFFHESQRRIQESAKERDASNGFKDELEDDDEDSPVIPSRILETPHLHHPDNSIMHCSQLDDSNVEGYGKIYVPLFGNSFVVQEAPFFHTTHTSSCRGCGSFESERERRHNGSGCRNPKDVCL